jgi:hypothetical protein
MVKVSTLFHRVDGFDETSLPTEDPELLDQEYADKYLNNLLKTLVFDPGDELVQKVLKQI